MKSNKLTPSDKGANLNKNQNYHNEKRAIKPTNSELESLINCMGSRANQARRFLKIIGKNPDTLTGHINKHSGVNLSAVARDQINPKIRKFGFYVDCKKPPEPIYNAYGEISNQFLWGIYKI